MIKNTYYSRDYERWITPIDEGKDTYCMVFGKSAAESRARAHLLDKLMGIADEPKVNSNHGDRHSGWSV